MGNDKLRWALRNHCRLWYWLYRHPGKTKGDWPGWNNFGPIEDNCFTCHVNKRTDYCRITCIIPVFSEIALGCENSSGPFVM